jgi:DNA-binding NarL/FixJ family response regulator
MRALLVDDHVLFSQGLRFLLMDLDSTIECEAASSIAAAETATGPFDLILLDYSLPDSQGMDGLQRMRHAHDGATIVILSGDGRDELVHEVVAEGAAGFIPKAADTDTLLDALRITLAGGIYLPPRACLPALQADVSPLKDLTPRQMDVLRKLVQGKPNKVIARELDIAESTIKSHLTVAFRALNVNTRAQAVFKAASWGLLDQ